MVAFFWNPCLFNFLEVEETGVPIESHHLRSGRSRSSRRKPPFKKWKKQGFQKKATI
jgi:hypothetical protein